MQNWSDQEVDEEVTALVDKFPDVEANFRYTVLRALKTAHQRNHGAKAPIRIRPENVGNISLAAFYKSFAQRLSRSPCFQTEKRFNGLSPSDTDIVCKDAFRHGLSAYVRKVAPLLVVSEGAETMAAAQKNSTVASTTESAITPQDSVSQAPSEVISIRPTRDDRLTASILRLHGGEKQKHAAESKPSKQLPSLSKASRASAKSSAKSYVRIPSVASRKSIVSVQQRKPTTVVNNEKSVAIPESDVIECDISTTKTRASTKSKRRSRSRNLRSLALGRRIVCPKRLVPLRRGHHCRTLSSIAKYRAKTSLFFSAPICKEEMRWPLAVVPGISIVATAAATSVACGGLRASAAAVPGRPRDGYSPSFGPCCTSPPVLLGHRLTPPLTPFRRARRAAHVHGCRCTRVRKRRGRRRGPRSVHGYRDRPLHRAVHHGRLAQRSVAGSAVPLARFRNVLEHCRGAPSKQ